jgi:hypothetical protein
VHGRGKQIRAVSVWCCRGCDLRLRKEVVPDEGTGKEGERGTKMEGGPKNRVRGKKKIQ